MTEVLVSIAVVSVLGALTAGVTHKVRLHAKSAQAVAGAKSLINAFQLYTTEHNGTYMPGIDKRLNSSNPAYYKGRAVGFSEAPHRYPFRLAPYLNDEFEGSIWLDHGDEQIVKNFGPRGSAMWDYGVSLQPAFGMNRHFIGGTVNMLGEYEIDSRAEAATHASEFVKGNTVVFISSGAVAVGMGGDGKDMVMPGWFEVTAPTGWYSMKWKSGVNPIDYGYVSARFNDKAVVAMLDGSVHMMGVEELRDMRLWSKNAQMTNNPNYVSGSGLN